ncbi:MAG: DUF5421 family protein [Chlamydiales bacterium]|nr:DUF5421 family protein [Chlamydiales bacterium]
MTRVPPVNQGNQSSQSDNEPNKSDNDDKKKKFELPKGGEASDAMMQAQLKAEQAAEAEGADVKASGIEASQMNNVSGLISKMVDSMQIGKVGGKDLLSAELKNTDDVPDAFKGAKVSIEADGHNLKISIEPLPGQQDLAASLVQQHHEAVQTLQQTLAQKGYILTQMEVGSHSVDLPKERITPLHELYSGSQSGRDGGEKKEHRRIEKVDE